MQFGRCSIDTKAGTEDANGDADAVADREAVFSVVQPQHSHLENRESPTFAGCCEN